MTQSQKKPADQSIADIQDEIVGDFELFDDWTEKYKYIIELGKKLPDLPEEYRTDDNKVKGCQSQVWLHGDLKDGVVYFDADSDAAIVRGLVSIALRVYSGHTPDEILANSPDFIDRIGFGQNLSMNRANGLKSVVAQIVRYAIGFKSLASTSASGLE